MIRKIFAIKFYDDVEGSSRRWEDGEEKPFMIIYKHVPASTANAVKQTQWIVNCLKNNKEDLKLIMKTPNHIYRLTDYIGSRLMDSFKKDGIELTPLCAAEAKEEGWSTADGHYEYTKFTRLQLFRQYMPEIARRVNDKMVWSPGYNPFMMVTEKTIDGAKDEESIDVRVTVCESGGLSIGFDAIEKICTTVPVPGDAAVVDPEKVHWVADIHRYEEDMRIDAWNAFVFDFCEAWAAGKYTIGQRGEDMLLHCI